MAASADVYASAPAQAFQGNINWTGVTGTISVSINCVLLGSGYTPSQDLTTEVHYSDISGNEISSSGTGYTTHGAVLSSCVATQQGATVYNLGYQTGKTYFPGDIVRPPTTITITGTPTGGTFTLTWNSLTTATIAYNASAATVLAALQALAGFPSGASAQAAGGALPGTAVTISYNEASPGPGHAITGNFSGLTGGSSPNGTVVNGNGFLYMAVILTGSSQTSTSPPGWPTTVGQMGLDGNNNLGWENMGDSITVFNSAAPVWASSTFNGANTVYYAALMALNSGTPANSALIALQTFAAGQTDSGGTFTITPDPQYGWFCAFPA